MARRKLQRYAELEELGNVFDGRKLEGCGWVEEFFGRETPNFLELGCGRGEYTLALAQQHPGVNAIGVDRRGARIWKGAKKALELEVSNAAFLRARIERLAELIPTCSVQQIWIPFPDPLPKRRHAKRRLISGPLLDVYRQVLRPSGSLHLKTDDAEFFQYAIRALTARGAGILEQTDDLYTGSRPVTTATILTRYERRFLDEGRRIKYVAFQLPAQ